MKLRIYNTFLLIVVCIFFIIIVFQNDASSKKRISSIIETHELEKIEINPGRN